jgi:FkbM family methyltransferase
MSKFIARFLDRLFLWLKILRIFRGLTLGSELNLWISSITDILFFMVSGVTLNIRLLLKGIFFYYIKGLGTVAVRGATDDLWNLLPGREGDVEEFIRSHLREGSVFVDVGANAGYYTLLASKLVGNKGYVYAIEPIPSTVALLEANVKLNNCTNVMVYRVAAWSSKGKLTLNVPASMYGWASVMQKGRSVMVKAETIDNILRNVGSVDILKVDVEGAELQVLQGAKEVLKRTKHIALELSYNISGVLRELQNTGFVCRKAHFTTYMLCTQKSKNFRVVP